MSGFSWGGRQWDGEWNRGNVFSIRLTVILPTVIVGPNAVVQTSFLRPPVPADNPMLLLVNASYALLRTAINDSSKTDTCWLCISDQPPFYDATASQEPIRNATTDSTCRWNTSTITITDIKGQGCCLGHIPANYTQYCLNYSTHAPCTILIPGTRLNSSYLHTSRTTMHLYTLPHSTTKEKLRLQAVLKGFYFIPGNNSIWACSTGATACAHGDVINKQNSFCIQVHIMPRITYYPASDIITRIEPLQFPLRQKREIVTALTLSILLGLGAAGAATGAAALAVGEQQVSALSLQVDEDLKRIETSIDALQTSLSSLAEVALQNRRGLDLLLLNKGGLCVALKEECCFYADHSGIVKDSMSELRKRIKDREYERQQNQPWYQGVFNLSPWLTTLLSTLIGPLILLLIACTIGPCVFSKLFSFLKHRLASINADVTHNTVKINALLSTNNSLIPEKCSLLQFSDSFSESEDETTTTASKAYGMPLMDLYSGGSKGASVKQ